MYPPIYDETDEWGDLVHRVVFRNDQIINSVVHRHWRKPTSWWVNYCDVASGTATTMRVTSTHRIPMTCICSGSLPTTLLWVAGAWKRSRGMRRMDTVAEAVLGSAGDQR